MGFLIFGVFFGLMFGFGLFLLVIYPALRERRQQAKQESSDDEQ